MKTGLETVLTLAFCSFLWHCGAEAQTIESTEVGRLNSNAAFTISVPTSSTATYETVSWGLTYGAGYNLSSHHALIGELMWNSLYPTSDVLAPIRKAVGDDSINGRGNLIALTANYRLQFDGRVYGTYLIGGGGLYYRETSLSRVVSSGSSVGCSPEWLWWGFSCTSGVVTSNQSLLKASTSTAGGNIGIGFTIKLTDSRYRFYIETRYHYAPHKSIATRVIPVSIGVRF